MSELVGKFGLFMYFLQEIGYFDQRIYFCDFGIDGFCCGGSIVGMWCYDQCVVFYFDVIEFVEMGVLGQLFEVDVYYFLDVCELGSVVGLDIEVKLILFFQGDKGWFWYEIFVYWLE